MVERRELSERDGDVLAAAGGQNANQMHGTFDLGASDRLLGARDRRVLDRVERKTLSRDGRRRRRSTCEDEHGRECGKQCREPPHEKQDADESARPLLRAFSLPLLQQSCDVMELRLAERHPLDDAARLARVVVGDRRLQALAVRRALPQLAPQPALQGDCRRRGGHDPGNGTLRFAPPSSSGLGLRPFTPAARVRIPLGVLSSDSAA